MTLHRLSARSRDLVPLNSRYGAPRDEWEQLEPSARRRLRCIAVALTMPRAVLVGASASAVRGLWTLPPREKDVVRVSLPGTPQPGRGRWPDGVVYVRSSLGEDDVEVIDGARVTGAARAVVDTARYEGWVRGVVAGDKFLRDGGTRDELAAEIERLRGCKGVAEAREMLQLVDERSESPYESLARVLFQRELGLSVVPQVWALEGVRVDLLVEGCVVVEIDGRVKYDGRTYSTDVADVVYRERQREIRLQRAGFEVLRFTTSELFKKPQWCCKLVDAAVERMRVA